MSNDSFISDIAPGVVSAEAVPFNDFVPNGHARPLPSLSLKAQYRADRMTDPERWDLCVAVRWIKSLRRDEAVLKNRARNGTLSRIKQSDLVAELLKTFEAAE